MRRALASDRYSALRDAVLRGAAVSASIGVASARWTCAQPAKAFAATRIAKLEKKVQQLAGGPHATDSTHRHRLRIAVKRLRYAIDFFRALRAGVDEGGDAIGEAEFRHVLAARVRVNIDQAGHHQFARGVQRFRAIGRLDRRIVASGQASLKLDKELLEQQQKVKFLSDELEKPLNVHRWRKLECTDPETYELIQKI